MSLREEDRQKNGCPSRTFGLAAAAIGVGVGAALYYFFSKRPENPSSEGASSENWHCESPQTLHEDAVISDDSYSTISVNTTTDTSFHDSSSSVSHSHSSNQAMSLDEDEDVTMDDDDFNNSNISTSTHSSEPSSYPGSCYTGSWDSYRSYDSGTSDVSGGWDTDIPMELPYFERPARSPARRLLDSLSELNRFITEDSRERRWSLEECSICFEVILRDQEVMALPCTHNFHQACILPWLQQQQTCPNCRKNVD